MSKEQKRSFNDPIQSHLKGPKLIGNDGYEIDIIDWMYSHSLQMYEHEHNKKMSSGAIAALLSTMLYYRRFFPYYVYNIIGGIDEEG